MVDLSHWDFAENFSGYDASALILGLEPRESSRDQGRINVVMVRMVKHYSNLVDELHWSLIDPDQRDTLLDDPPNLVGLASIKMKELIRLDCLYGADAPLDEWLQDLKKSQFDYQKFERSSITRWLTQIGMKSVYQFDLKQPSKPDAAIAIDIDPADLPEELHAANIAFRAVNNLYGDPSATFRNRLISYLKTNFPDLSSDAVKRIATVANPDKAPGRKNFNAE